MKKGKCPISAQLLVGHLLSRKGKEILTNQSSILITKLVHVEGGRKGEISRRPLDKIPTQTSLRQLLLSLSRHNLNLYNLGSITASFSPFCFFFKLGVFGLSRKIAENNPTKFCFSFKLVVIRAEKSKMAAGHGGKVLFMTVVVVLFSVAVVGGKRAAAAVHHVVGDDRGWEPSTDIVSWFSGRVFRVGDKIWFSYSQAQESIVELQTLEEFLSCDLTNPIRMYSGGLDTVYLDSEGTRFFASGNIDSCKNGLKLPVKVRPQGTNVRAAGPTAPSASTQITGLSFTLVVGFVLCLMGL